MSRSKADADAAGDRMRDADSEKSWANATAQPSDPVAGLAGVELTLPRGRHDDHVVTSWQAPKATRQTGKQTLRSEEAPSSLPGLVRVAPTSDPHRGGND